MSASAAQAADDRHFHSLPVLALQPAAEDALLLSLDVPESLRQAFHYMPGQYLTLRQPGREPRRAYSICAGPGEVLQVGIRRVPGGAFSSWVHAGLRPGQMLEVMPPQGRFGAGLAELAQAGPCHVLALAGGSGITPVLAIVKSLLARHQRCRVSVLYGNRSVASSMFLDALEDLKNRYLARLALHLVFSREQLDSPLASGRLDAERITSLLRLVGPMDQALVCGPHGFNDQAEAALRAAGLAPQRIHIERFGAPPLSAGGGSAIAPAMAEPQALPLPAPDAGPVRISIQRDGLRREFDYLPGDGSVLAAAARAGLELPFSCRSGVCATCRARVVAGEVRLLRNFALSADELAAGFVLGCQAQPMGQALHLDFDQR